MIKSKRLIIILSIALLILMTPLAGMQFSDQIKWTVFDFTIMGILLTGIGLLVELVLRKVSTPRNRILILSGVILLFFLIWAELAVGVFGTPWGGS
jgi:hypothetical protein